MKPIKNFLKKNIPMLVKLKHMLFGEVAIKYIEINIVDHCNLKCNACTHFSNISEPNFVDARILSFHFKRLKKIFYEIKKFVF